MTHVLAHRHEFIMLINKLLFINVRYVKVEIVELDFSK